MTRSRLKNEYLKSPTSFNWMNYKRQSNLCVSLNRRSRREYFSKLDCKNQQTVKSFWKSIRPYFTDKVKSSSKTILIEKRIRLSMETMNWRNALVNTLATFIKMCNPLILIHHIRSNFRCH